MRLGAGFKGDGGTALDRGSFLDRDFVVCCGDSGANDEGTSFRDSMTLSGKRCSHYM